MENRRRSQSINFLVVAAAVIGISIAGGYVLTSSYYPQLAPAFKYLMIAAYFIAAALIAARTGKRR